MNLRTKFSVLCVLAWVVYCTWSICRILGRV